MPSEAPVATKVHVSREHDNSRKQPCGEAIHVDDISEPHGTLHVYIAQSTHAHARVTRLDLAEVMREKGVVAVITSDDIPGEDEMNCVEAGDERVFAKGVVSFEGQPLFAVVAETIDVACAAALKADVAYEPLPAILTIDDAMRQRSFLAPPRIVQRGDPDRALAAAPHRLQGRIRTSEQDHCYLETQNILAIPQEDGDLHLLCSTQNPGEVQSASARMFWLADSAVTADARRMGGAFSGKEAQANALAVIAALAAVKTGRPAKVRLDRDDDIRMAGKCHEFEIDYDVGFDNSGLVCGITFVQKLRCGASLDLSVAVADRGIFHCDNAYFLENVRVESYRCKTHTVSNTTFRGFGVLQGVIGIERVMLDIAHHLGLDPLDVRRRNLYAVPNRSVTHYGQPVSSYILPSLIDQLCAMAKYHERRRDIAVFNQTSRVFRRGMALTPVMMGISFSRTHLNQAGVLIHIHKDGSIALNHGGTEMGRGLFIKVAQIVAQEFDVRLDRIKINATTTARVPNTSPTASSAGLDLNGMAARAAARTLKDRLVTFAAEHFKVPASQIAFVADRIQVGNRTIAFEELIKAAYRGRILLSATGYFKTPEIHFDSVAFSGRPFSYFAFGAAISQVIVDRLTGEYRVERVDILHEVGRSPNPAIDIRQIQGGFMQGVGWLTTEKVWWDGKDRLRTHAPSTYKIPATGHRPAVMNVALMANPGFRAETPYWSKAVDEPPLALSISVHQALLEAVVACGASRPKLDAPATPERVLLSIVDGADASLKRLRC